MTENMSNNSPTTMKKRKANDGQATALDSSHGGGGGVLFSSRLGRDDNTTPTASSTTTCGGENLMQKMDAMMQMMSRMEERQLVNMSSLERRCEKLEAKCNKLEHMLETKTNSIKEHVDSKFDKQHEYNSMLVKNQSWKYSTPVYSEVYWENNGYDADVARYLTESSDCLKELTEKMRQGEFPSDYSDGRKGINLDWDEGDPILDPIAISKMRPHWREFVDALEQFTSAFDAVPHGCETYLILENIQLDRYVPGLLKDALMNKPFQQLSFVNRDDVEDNEGMSLEDITDMINSNKHLRKLTIVNNRIQLGNIINICAAVRRGSIVELDLRNCFENGLDDEMMTCLLTNGGLAKLQRLSLASNRITSTEIALLANFLATNPPLQKLDLDDNFLADNDAEALANALQSNTTLRKLSLSSNSIGDAGTEALRLVLHDDSSLNSIADSNHSCSVVFYQFYCWNVNETCRENRARKIYKLLSERNKSTPMSNVQYFDEVDVKLLPDMLEAVQSLSVLGGAAPGGVAALSIVYEVMRKWDKVFPLYVNQDNEIQ